MNDPATNTGRAHEPAPTDPDELGQSLRAGVAGHDLPGQAAVALLVGHGYWLGRADFRRACVETCSPDQDDHGPDDDGAAGAQPAPVWVLWDEAPGFAARARASTGETAVLRAAASIAGAGGSVSLRDLVRDLSAPSLALVLDAIAHAAGWHENARSWKVTGRLPVPTPRHLVPVMTRLRSIEVAVRRAIGRSALDAVPSADGQGVPSPDPIRVVLGDFRDVVVHPDTRAEAGGTLGWLLERQYPSVVVVDLGVDLATDPDALAWLVEADEVLTNRVCRYVPAAADWDPLGHKAQCRLAAQALMVPVRSPFTARPAPSTTPAAPTGGSTTPEGTV